MASYYRSPVVRHQVTKSEKCRRPRLGIQHQAAVTIVFPLLSSTAIRAEQTRTIGAQPARLQASQPVSQSAGQPASQTARQTDSHHGMWNEISAETCSSSSQSFGRSFSVWCWQQTPTHGTHHLSIVSVSTSVSVSVCLSARL